MKTLPYRSKIANLSELKATLLNNEKSQLGVLHFLSAFKYEALCRSFEKLKSSGISFSRTFLSLCLLRFTNLTVYGQYRSGLNVISEFQKDVFYRLMNNSFVDWRKLVLNFARKFIKLTVSTPDSDEIKCFILDDSGIEKTGKTIEFIGKIFDHVFNRYVLGFRLMVLGYFDGKSFIGVDFSLHREKGKNAKKPYGMNPKDLKTRFQKTRINSSPGATRVKELDMTKIESGIKMLQRAAKKGFKASYVLFDSWFFSDKLVKAIREINDGSMHVLGMCKLGKRTFTYLRKDYSPKELLKKLEKKKKRSRKLRAHYIEAVVIHHGVTMKLFYSRYVNCKDWKLIVSTDLRLNYPKAIEIYQIRWTIEVFFKETKQYLNLGKCQSNDFDAQIADTSLAMITYMLLTMQKRMTNYETIGGAFRENRQEMLELTLWERIWGLFQEILAELTELFEIDMDEIIQKLTRDDQTSEKYLAILRGLEINNSFKKSA